MNASSHFDSLKIIELQELLKDDGKINQMVRFSRRFQRLQRAADKMVVSNYRMAKVSLSYQPALKDGKFHLSEKYQALDNLNSTIQVKQHQLGVLMEDDTLSMALWHLREKVVQAEEECEVIFQNFIERRLSLDDFVESFQSCRKVAHTRLVMVEKFRDIIKIENQDSERPNGTREMEPVSMDFPVELPNTCHLLYSVTPATIILSDCYQPFHSIPVHSAFLPPLCDHLLIYPLNNGKVQLTPFNEKAI
ncbi:vacuolar protein sorting-associated protein 37B-like [Aplochiton taeniatus]